MSDDRALAQEGVDEAFKAGIGRLFEVLAQGILMDQPKDVLRERAVRGLKNFHAAHGEMTELVEDFFAGKTS